MQVLIVAATQMELKGVQQKLATLSHPHHIAYLVTDVGMMATTFHLTQHLMQHTYDLVIQIGIAGAFDTSLQLGDMVEVVSETYGDVGAEDGATTLSIFEMQLLQQDARLFTANRIQNTNTFTSLPQVSSISVNMCSGNEKTIAYRKAYFQAQLETMEGMGIHYVAQQLAIPYVHLRAISNYVTNRDKSTWDIPLAISNLSNFVSTFVAQL